MKKHLPLLAALVACLAIENAAAQVVTVAAGTNDTNQSPFNHSKANSAYEAIYTQKQLGQAGTIVRLALEKGRGDDQTPLTNVVLYLKTTAASVLQSGKLDTTGYQRVWAGAFPNAGVSGYQEVELRAPFGYDNAQNLSLLVLRKNGSQASTSAQSYWRYGFQGTGNNVCRRNTTSDAIVQGGTTLSAYDLLLNLRLTFGTVTGTRAGATLLADVYPNPATAACRVQLPSATQPATYALLDALGRVVRPATRLPLSAAGTAELPLAELPAGLYLLRLTQGAATSVHRLVKQ